MFYPDTIPILLDGMSAGQFADWRTRLDLSKFQAALLLGVTERTITNYENRGNIPFTTYIACISFECCPEMRRKIPDIIAQRSQSER